MNRRDFLARSAAAAAGLTVIPVGAVGQDATQVIGVYRRGVGDIVVTALLDGHLTLDPAMLQGADAQTTERLLRAAFLEAGPVPTSINAFLIQTGERTVMVDGGAGPAMGPSAGMLPMALASAGVFREDIDAIFATHLHPDHVGAFTSGGGAAAPGAELILHAAERDFWTDDANFSGAGEQARSFMRMARDAIAPYAERTRTVADGAEIAPGVSAVHLPGHTPGHTGLRVESGGAQLLIWADIVHVGPVQFARPDVTIPFDVDPEQAAATRKRVMDMVAADRLEVAGAHIDHPGFGHLTAAGQGYAFTPGRWDHAL